MHESTQAVLLLALISALARAGLNIIDRHQIGLMQLSIRSVNFWNNFAPAALITIAAIGLDYFDELAAFMLSWRTAIFAAIIQIVAYVFSYAFRYLSVNQVTVTTKLSDFFIPIGVFLTTSHWSWLDYAFSVATTIVCLPILRGSDPVYRKNIITIGIITCAALVFQASISPYLAQISHEGLPHILLFATAVLIWRTFWSALPMAYCLQDFQLPAAKSIFNRVFLLRCTLTVITQFTFLFAVSSAASSVAWPILNTTGLFAMVIASFTLREQQANGERIIVIVITLLAILRFTL